MRTLNLFLLFFFLFALNSYSLPECTGDYFTKWDNCYGTYILPDGAKYVGEWRNGKHNGEGAMDYRDGGTYQRRMERQ